MESSLISFKTFRYSAARVLKKHEETMCSKCVT